MEEARKIANENTENFHLKLVKIYNESHKTPKLKIGDKVLYKIPYQSGQEIDKPCQPENKHATIVNISKVKLWDPVTEDNTEPPFPFQEEEDLEGCLGIEPKKQASTDSPQNMPRRSRPLIGRNTAASRRYRNARAIETPLQSETRRALRRLRYSEARNHADYRAIIHSDKLPPEEHERRYNAPMTNEVALLMKVTKKMADVAKSNGMTPEQLQPMLSLVEWALKGTEDIIFDVYKGINHGKEYQLHKEKLYTNAVAKPNTKKPTPPPIKQLIKPASKNFAAAYESHVVIKSSNPATDSREILREIQKADSSILNSPEVAASVNGKGRLVIHTKTTQGASTLAARLQANKNIPKSLNCTERPTIYPRYCLFGVESSTTNDMIVGSLQNNDFIKILPGKRHIKVAHRPKDNPHGYTTVFLEADDQTANFLEHRGNQAVVLASAYWHNSVPDLSFLPTLESAINIGSFSCILGMDANAHSPTWGIGATRDARGASLEDSASLMGLQFLGSPNHYTWSNGSLRSSIDVTLASSSLAIRATRSCLQEMAFSDHLPILTNFDDIISTEPICSWVETSCLEETFTAFIGSSLHHVTSRLQTAFTPGDIDEVVTLLTTCLQEACNVSMRKKSKSPRPSRPWWNKELSKLRNLVVAFRRCYQSTSFYIRSFFKGLYRACHNKLKAAIRREKHLSWITLCQEVSSAAWSSIHRYISKGRRGSLGPPLLKHDDGTPLTPEETCHEVLQHYFPTDWTAPTPSIDWLQPYNQEPAFTVSEVLRAIRRCGRRKSPLRKKRIAILIPKQNSSSSNQLEKYRPITLLNTLAKVLERCILARLQWIADYQGWFSPHQFGFLPGRSAEMALDSINNNISEGLQHWRKTLAIGLDISHAFDTVQRHTIIQGLRDLNCPEELIQLSASFLRGRQVIYNAWNATLTSTTLLGVPQGAALSPFYFNIVARKIHLLPRPNNSEIISFADDFTVLIHFLRRFPTREINQFLKQLFHWGKTQGLTFNPRKTQACLFHWKAKRPGYHGIHFQNQPILIDNTIKILGVTFDSKRNFVGHLDNILKRCSCTSFQAELLAILYATRSIKIMPRQDFVIASDCQAALHAICHPDIPRTPLTAEIIRNLNTLDNVQLCWVRSHCGIVGNEQADEVAKAAAQSKLPLHFATLPRKYVRSQSKQFALQLWTDLYTTDHATRNLRRVAASPSLLISILPKLKYCNVTSTILTGHGFVQADIARASKNNDPVCQHCHQENQTVDHLLFSCPSYHLQRFQTATLLNTSTFNQEALKNLPKNKTAWRHLITTNPAETLTFLEYVALDEGLEICGSPELEEKKKEEEDDEVKEEIMMPTRGEVIAALETLQKLSKTSADIDVHFEDDLDKIRREWLKQCPIKYHQKTITDFLKPAEKTQI
ncbi:hypothetical protein LAZ67_9003318 [Cordylochernes scorpioides]|uniref:Uncharacterized protein n=1 Tax=Cordylochernes scorpioides TaxID=51811 RepID=A0ABY6KZD8_9ARAC|nr:hypothetical protein LAZ67_9003318 [Cordylochernes scorpioides]